MHLFFFFFFFSYIAYLISGVNIKDYLFFLFSLRAVPELTIWGGWAAAFLFFYAWSGSTEFVFRQWLGIRYRIFSLWARDTVPYP